MLNLAPALRRCSPSGLPVLGVHVGSRLQQRVDDAQVVPPHLRVQYHSVRQRARHLASSPPPKYPLKLSSQCSKTYAMMCRTLYHSYEDNKSENILSASFVQCMDKHVHCVNLNLAKRTAT